MGRCYDADKIIKEIEQFLKPDITESERDLLYDMLDESLDGEYHNGFLDGIDEPCKCPDPDEEYDRGYEQAQEDFEGEAPDTLELIDALKKNDYDHAQVLLGRCGIHVLKAQLKP